jgi:hypothetical protein
MWRVQEVSNKIRIPLVIIALVFAVFLVDYLFRCHGRPLSREEAFERANAKLLRFSKKFVVGDSLSKLNEEQYDPQRKEWMFTFENSTCSVIIIADRCNGTDIGGISKGCTVR